MLHYVSHKLISLNRFCVRINRLAISTLGYDILPQMARADRLSRCERLRGKTRKLWSANKAKSEKIEREKEAD